MTNYIKPIDISVTYEPQHRTSRKYKISFINRNSDKRIPSIWIHKSDLGRDTDIASEWICFITNWSEMDIIIYPEYKNMSVPSSQWPR